MSVSLESHVEDESGREVAKGPGFIEIDPFWIQSSQGFSKPGKF